ncbi:MAG: N-acetyltransferase [Bacteroidales bacterium]|nr:N-acetyltransferase [Bacteroidales bacterium]
MSVEIRKIDPSKRKDLRQFVLFPETLYRHNPYYVPCLVFDEMDTLNPARNPASDFCDQVLYMAYIDGKPVGRIAGIINRWANEHWNHDEVRFGWFDTIDDREVSAALIAKVEEFGREHGMTHIVGPLGFTDFDPEGMLVEGFDQESTMPLIYNHPYYVEHIEALGFSKDVDWLEYRIFIPEKVPEKFARVADIVARRNNFHIRPVTRKLIREEDYATKIFALITECYKDLYEYTMLPDNLADKYIGFYLKVLDLRYISVVENENNEIVAFGITMPSLADALKKSRGRLFPFGWWHLAKALFIKHSEGSELLLMGARPDVRNTGVTALLVADMFDKYNKLGVKWSESNAELEDNHGIRNTFEPFERIQNKRRRSYKKAIEQ